ncbi:MAG: GNAT family N-acetyltransferase [Acidimicrobiales bacterium]
MRSPTLEKVQALNQVLLRAPAAFEKCVALTDEYMSEFAFRHLVIEDGKAAAHLEDSFLAAGWKVERGVTMALDRQPDRKVDTSAVVELDEDQMLRLMKLWALEEHVGIESDRLDQLMEYNRRVGRAWNERRFGMVEDDGSPVAITKLRMNDAIAWVEDVYTVPEARERGYARMLVTHVTATARSAGKELTFILADDDDWPKNLYSRIGFERVGQVRMFRSTSSA